MSGKDQIAGRIFKLRANNQDVVEMVEGSKLALAADQLVFGDSDAPGLRNVLSGESNLTLTAAMSGSLILMDDATQAFVLPALTADTIGIYYDFNSTVAATTTTITAGAADLLTGGVFAQSSTATAGDAFQPDVSDDLIITLNGAATGGAIGSWLRLTGISATRWLVQGVLLGTGATMTTPFS